MSRVPKLTDAQIADALSGLNGWSVQNEKLHKEYKFADFMQAFGFMSMAALRIEAMNHHPEWSNVYSTVSVNLTTHDSGGISSKDAELAGILDQVAATFL